MSIGKYYTCVVIRIDAFESTIIDEKHFSTFDEAAEYKRTLETGLVCVIAEI